jgi:hypothetical protein
VCPSGAPRRTRWRASGEAGGARYAVALATGGWGAVLSDRGRCALGPFRSGQAIAWRVVVYIGLPNKGLQPTRLPAAAPLGMWRCSPSAVSVVRCSVSRRSAEACR